MEVDNQMGYDIEDDIHSQLLGRYVEEKGLNNVDGFDVEDSTKWQAQKCVFDRRSPEQRNKEQNKVITLQEMIDMIWQKKKQSNTE